jgi:hypothetical protein
VEERNEDRALIELEALAGAASEEVLDTAPQPA